MTSEAIGSLSIAALKAILYTNRVNAGMILEKSDLIAEVKALASNKRREREQQRVKEQGEVGKVARQRALSEQSRVQRRREGGTYYEHEDNVVSEQRGKNNNTRHSGTTPESLMPFDRGQEINAADPVLCTPSAMLMTLRGAGSLTSNLYLQDAARLALGIVDAIQVRTSWSSVSNN
jgi:hypothetical protein